MSITASIHIHSPASDTEVRAHRPAVGDQCWITVEEEGSYGSAEVTVFGSPDELHAFALRMVAAIEAEWPDIECRSAGLIHRAGCDHEETS